MKNATLLFLMFFIQLGQSSYAIHLIGGHLALEHQSGLNYKVRVTTLTDPTVSSDRCIYWVKFNDNDSVLLKRVNGTQICHPPDIYDGEIVLPGFFRYNIYEGTKTFSEPGIYKATLLDQNRTEGIINIPGSVNIPFYLETEILVLDPNFYCPVSSPDFGFFPSFFGTIPTGYQGFMPINKTQGDSISYDFDTCRAENGIPINGYFLPGNFSINPLNGQINLSGLQWIGSYALAIRVNKWRHGNKVSSSLLDYSLRVSQIPTGAVLENVNTNLTQVGANFFKDNLTINDSIKISFSNQYYRVSSEIDSLVNIVSNSDSVFLSISDLSALERSQPYQITLQLLREENLNGDFNFQIFVGSLDSIQCSAPFSLALNNFEKKQGFILFPNPANGIVHLEFDENFIGDIEIMNVCGGVVHYEYQKTFDKNYNIDISNLVNGIYFINVVSNQQIFNTKFVKN